MVINARYVNWFDEKLDQFYGHENDGLIHGIYVFSEDDFDFPFEVMWFDTEEKARAELLNI